LPEPFPILIHNTRSSPFPNSLAQNHHDPIKPSQDRQSHLEQEEANALISPLAVGIPARVARHVQISAYGPAGAHDGGREREAQAGQQQRRQHRRLVLDVVGVGALGAVEAVRGGVGARRGRVRGRVRDARGFAGGARVEAVDGVEEEGRGGGEEDVAIGKGASWLARCGFGVGVGVARLLRKLEARRWEHWLTRS
jgi:hypothetical protein